MDEPPDGAGDETVAPERELQGAETLEDELGEELAVLHRVFRHDVRNRLNVVLGRAELARAETDDEAVERHLDGVLDAVGDLTETVDQVGLIQGLASSEYTPDVVNVAPTLRELVSEYDDRTAAAFESSVPEEVWVWLNPRYEVAFRELVENAVVHNDAPAPRVTVRVSQEETTEVVVADNGPGMPPGTKASLDSGAVDPTRHLTSLGLLTAYWILTRSGGTLTIENDEPRGCRITVALRSALPPRRDGTERR